MQYEGGRVVITIKAFTLVRILRFPYNGVRIYGDDKGEGHTYSMANLNLSSKVLMSS